MRRGKLAGEDIAAATGGMGDVAVIVSNLEAENQRERLEGFRQALEGYPDIRIAEIIEGNSDARALNECISQLLEEEKELDAVFCAEGYSATTICQLIRNAKGEYDDLKVSRIWNQPFKTSEHRRGHPLFYHIPGFLRNGIPRRIRYKRSSPGKAGFKGQLYGDKKHKKRKHRRNECE